VNTEQLIANLSADVPRVTRHALAKRIAIGVLAGSLAAMVLVAVVLGIRPDLDVAMRGFPFWMKWAYSISLAAGAGYAVSRLARPAPRPLRMLWLLAIPVLILAGIGIGELARTPANEWLGMWLGSSFRVCPFIVLALAAPIFAGLLWSFRRLAPTRLRAAGAAAGLAAGAWAATIYCLHCPEASALFVLTWYSLGILLATGIGALLGPRFLRW
jgi:hypothetical protein